MGFGLWLSGLGLAWPGDYESGAEAPPLFDKCIGRKRDVGGGFLAGRRCGPDFGVS